METNIIGTAGFLEKPSDNVLQALQNLEKNKDFRVIRDWILSSSGDVDNILRNAESVAHLHRAQGASRVLLGFTSHATDPGKLLAKIKRQRAGIVFDGETAETMPNMII